MSGWQVDVHTVNTSNKGENTHQDGDAGHQFEDFIEVVGGNGAIGFANVAKGRQARLGKLSELFVSKGEIFDEVFIFFI